jgi:ketopantoate reductase
MSARLIWEGIQVIRANGFKEHELGSIPPWRVFRVSAMLPKSVTGFLYRFVIREDLGLNSTAQDLRVGKTTTELESFNGYLLTLARKAGVPMPINQAVYEIAKERFGPDFQPMTETELLTSIKKKLKK